MADVPAPVPYDDGPASYELFGVNWVRRVLHLERILRTVDQVLGDQIALGPIGAGPGRAFASISFVGTYHPTTGHEIPAELLTYALNLPISVVFDLDLPMDRLTFNGEVVIPLVLVVHTEEPLKLRLELRTPTEDQIQLQLHTDTRRGSVIRKIAGIDGELRRFVLKVIDTELRKPYVKKATHLDMEALISEAWPALTQQFLPRGPEDRRSE
ncbi:MULTISPECIES: hypothetical protein [unclassified Nocardioides]|uniref:hypothetical protein n=1 Tax=unclassified Nocardioides TaxID=2615069 RepID=UPI0006FD02D1|nr:MULTISPECIES: hypothetical protein [unclassified Nocardioides]KRA39210.1 hypothetical protein ASD81_11865 [Nocardioides sp. Root614]KRA93169.1 hypothetical protein ASD84_12130 [Nocardioides sp. Root682]